MTLLLHAPLYVPVATVNGFDVCPTEEFPQQITFNKFYVEMSFGDDSNISMDI